MLSTLFALDLSVLQALYTIRTLPRTYFFIGVSQAGEWYVLAGIALIAILILLLRRKFAYAQGMALALVTSIVGVTVIKTLVNRPRPPMSFWAYTESGPSFPSAHATVSFAVCGFFAYLIWRSALPCSLRISGVVALYAIVLLIGFSRIYLGVHYLSDIVGGYLLGLLCLWLSITFTRILQKPTPRAF